MNRLIAALSGFVLVVTGLFAVPSATAADFVNAAKPGGNNSTLSSITYSPDRVNAGETFNFSIDGSTSITKSFFGCHANSTDGVIGERFVSSNLWAGAANVPATNATTSPIVQGLHLWFADDSSVPANCDWTTGVEPHLETFVTILPSNIECVILPTLPEGTSTHIGDVEVYAKENETTVWNNDPNYYWFSPTLGQLNVELVFSDPVDVLGFRTYRNADNIADNETISLEFEDASGELVLDREYVNVDMSETLWFDEPVSNLIASYEGIGSLLEICILVDSIVDPCEPTVTEDGDYTYLEFAAGIECEWTVPEGVEEIDYIVGGAGGGGGGGGLRDGLCVYEGSPNADLRIGGGGAGGAGGLVTEGDAAVQGGQKLRIREGAGGAGGAGGGCPVGGSGEAGTNGETGQGSWIAGIAYASGGRGGDAGNENGNGGHFGGSNDSFVGGEYAVDSLNCSSVTTDGCWAAPGGAGAGAAGQTVIANGVATFGGNGGDGVQVEFIDGYYGGGGAGNIRHCFSSPAGTRAMGTGGLGGGGGIAGAAGDTYCTGTSWDGTDGLGGGGAGGRGNGSLGANSTNAGPGGAGGDGRVTIKFLTPNNEPVVIAPSIDKTTMKNATVDWEITSGADQITGYKIYLNGQLIETLDAEALSYKFTGLNKNTQYDVTIVPILGDEDGTEFYYSFHTPNQVVFKVPFDSNSPVLTKFAKMIAVKNIKNLPDSYSNLRVEITGWVNYLQPENFAIRQLARSRAAAVKKFMTGRVEGKITTRWRVPKSVTFQAYRVARVVITYTPDVQPR